MFPKSLMLAALAVAITAGPGAAVSPDPWNDRTSIATASVRSHAPVFAQRYPPAPRSLCAKSPYEGCGSTDA